MRTNRKTLATAVLATGLALCFGQGAQAQDEWTFGIGTGISSFSLDGDLGFPTSAGNVIVDVDLDNSDTQDLLESGFGFGGFAAKGKWRIHFTVGTRTLEDNDSSLDAEWDNTMIEAAGEYNFAQTGKHSWGALFGLRNIDHDWKVITSSVTADFDESWTDGLVGVTHALPFANKWSWNNRLDYSFGDSEGSSLIMTSVSRRIGNHWVVNGNLKQHSIDFGEKEDILDSDFYLYDIDEPAIGVGFMYLW